MNRAVQNAIVQFLEDPSDPVAGALIVAQAVNANAKVDWAREEIIRLADGVAPGGGAQPADVVAALAKEGFQGAGERYYEIENSALDCVLRNRRGIPISLGVLHIGVARQLGLDAVGINFPRHFLVTIGGLLIDPYRLAPTSIEICRAWLKENNVDEEDAFAIATPKDIVVRMLNNVRLLVHQSGDFLRSLEMSDYLLLMVPDAYGLYVERADAWLRLNAPEMVVAELEKAAERAPDKAIEARLRERAAEAKRHRSIVH